MTDALSMSNSMRYIHERSMLCLKVWFVVLPTIHSTVNPHTHPVLTAWYRSRITREHGILNIIAIFSNHTVWFACSMDNRQYKRPLSETSPYHDTRASTCRHRGKEATKARSIPRPCTVSIFNVIWTGYLLQKHTPHSGTCGPCGICARIT